MTLCILAVIDGLLDHSCVALLHYVTHYSVEAAGLDQLHWPADGDWR